MTQQTIDEWFKRAVPNPTDETRCVQIGCHYEEVAEMASVLCDHYESPEELSVRYKMKRSDCLSEIAQLTPALRRELLDSLCDQIVTARGVAHMFGMDIEGALAEVNRSNWSKFDADGNPLFNEQGKIAKGPNYTPPDLTPFIGVDTVK